MTNITAAMVKELRESTGAGMLDCKKALTETNGDMEQAVDWLRKKGLASAAKKASRIAAEGLVAVAVDGNAVCAIQPHMVIRTSRMYRGLRDVLL